MGDDLARRLNRNLYARMENILRVGQGEVCRPAPEQFLKGLQEIRIDLLKALNKELAHLAGEVADQALQLVAALLNVGHLCVHKCIPLADLFVFLYGRHIDRSQCLDLAL